MAQATTASTDSVLRSALATLRARLFGQGAWCPGTGTQLATGATKDGMASCPNCPRRVPTEPGPMARYRIIGEHPA